jgi:cyclin-like protein
MHPQQPLPQHASRYPACDSYFVESDEISLAERLRERQRAINKQRQREMGAELSAVTSDEYCEDILDHMEHMEALTMPDVSSIDIQQEIQWYMRPYLLDFLVEAHAVFSLLPETLYLTVNILDRYCSRRVVYKRHYQLVACASLLTAAKYGDKKDRVPTFRELRSICCQLYDEEMFAQMEWHVLQTLDWVLGAPTIDGFLQIALSDSDLEDPELTHMTWYICEMALYHRDFVSVRPSVLARSALALSRAILQRPQPLEDSWAGRFDSMIIFKLIDFLPNPSQVLARKYSSTKLSTVAQTVEQFIEVQKRQQANATPVSSERHCDSGYATPTTPNKQAYAPISMPNGCLTPPITPDNEMNHCLGYSQPAHPYPTTPSPVPSHYQHDIGQHSFSTDCYLRPVQ